ncbi:hypothetical protein B0J12DRAFT_570030 [Macrophomina phaseolina]|uniref:Zn(2)-C6 fungal-type domain-containing protein n=1 Tax=Macrophomina phaseolina TaxID=35725 RepID=A0ABQ8GIZ9_9PEZI|nr:hypothetical protein B0J12DRAFT_570030 [Macrophomina phaseolina]
MGPFGYAPFGATSSLSPGYGGPTLALQQPASLASQVPLRNTKTARRNKAHVASACVNCKRAHLSCDVQRPCTRCVTSGKEQATCYDVQHKKRGRPRLRDAQDSRPAQGHELSEQSTSASESPAPGLAAGSGRPEPFRSLRSTRRSFGASAAIRQPTSQLHSLSPSPFPPEGSVQYPGPEYPRLAPSLVTPMALLNLDLHIIKTNPAFDSLTGRSDLPGRELADLVESHHVDTLQRLRGELREERDAREPSYMPPIFGPREREAVQDIEEEDLDRISQGYTDRTFTWRFSSIFGQPQEVRVRVRLAKTSIFFVSLALPPFDRSQVQPTRSEHQPAQLQPFPPAFATPVARQRSSRPPSRAAPTPMSDYAYPYGQNSPLAVSEPPSPYSPYFSLQSLTSSLPPAQPSAYDITPRRQSGPVLPPEGAWHSEPRTWQPQQYPFPAYQRPQYMYDPVTQPENLAPAPAVRRMSSDERRSQDTSEGAQEEEPSKRRRLNIRDLV